MSYEDSLQQAISNLESQLKEKNDAHAKRSLQNLEQLKADYTIQYKQNFH